MSKIFKKAYILSHYLFRKKSYLLLNILYLIAEKLTVPDKKIEEITLWQFQSTQKKTEDRGKDISYY